MGGNFASAKQFDGLRVTLEELKAASERFPRGEPLLGELIPRISEMVSRGEKGEIFFGGRWTTSAALTAEISQRTSKDSRKVKTISGEEYVVKRADPDGILVVTSSGYRKVPFTEFPEAVQKEFNFDPVAAEAYSERIKGVVAMNEQRAAREKREAAEAAARKKAEEEKRKAEELAMAEAAKSVNPAPPQGQGLTMVPPGTPHMPPGFPGGHGIPGISGGGLVPGLPTGEEEKKDEAPKWTSKLGETISGDLVNVDKERKLVQIKRSDTGRIIAVDYSNFLEANVKLIEAFEPPEGRLVLSGNWAPRLDRGKVAAQELDRVLQMGNSGIGIDLTGDPDVELYSGIKYLENLESAKQKIASRTRPGPVATNMVVTSGFPHETIYYHKLDGKFERFNHIILVTDVANQVVAVQLVNNSPPSVWLSSHSSQRGMFNFVQNRRKGSSQYRVAWDVEEGDGWLRVDSELVDKRGKSREWVRLIMAKKFGAVIRHRNEVE